MAKRRSGGPGISFFAFQDIITAVVGIFILITLIMVLELAQRVEAASQAQPEDIQPVTETIETLQQQNERLAAEIESRTTKMNRNLDLNAFNVSEKTEQLKQQNAALQLRIETSTEKQRLLNTELYKAEFESKQLAVQSQSLAGQRKELDEMSKTAAQVTKKINVLLGEGSTIYRDEVETGRFMVLITLSPGSIQIRDALSRTINTFNGARRTDDFQDWIEQVDLQRRHLLVLIEPGGVSDFDTVRQSVTKAKAQYGYSVIGPNHAVRLGFELGTAP